MIPSIVQAAHNLVLVEHCLIRIAMGVASSSGNSTRTDAELCLNHFSTLSQSELQLQQQLGNELFRERLRTSAIVADELIARYQATNFLSNVLLKKS